MHEGNPSQYTPVDRPSGFAELAVPDRKASASLFDAIRRVDEHGEYWSARELMELMAYTNWRQFGEVIDRAKAAAVLTNLDVTENFEPSRKVSGRRGPAGQDYRLTRDAAYLVAMNGDPRKEEVAAAQRYFAEMTRKQELAEQAAAAPPAPVASTIPAMPSLDDLDPGTLVVLGQIGQALAETSQALILQKRLNAVQALELDRSRRKAEYVDAFVDPVDDTTLFRTFCNQTGHPERKLRDHLVANGLIYKKKIGRRWSRSQRKWVEEYEYHPHAAYRPWFKVVDQPDAPRHHNGQMRTTLYFTAVGKTKILDWLAKHPIEVNA